MSNGDSRSEVSDPIDRLAEERTLPAHPSNYSINIVQDNAEECSRE